MNKSTLIDSLIETARKTQAISSSSEKGRVLRDLATQPVYDDRIVTAILEALSSLKSSDENASVLRTLLARADLSSNAFTEIARAIKSISSSEARSGVLTTMVRSCPTADDVLLAFLDTTFSISSSSEKEEILLALLRRKGLSTRIISQVKEMASSKIASTANRNSVLNAVSKYEREHEFELDGVGCLSKLGTLAVGKRAGFRLPLPAQEDKAFMWKAPSFHPLQVLENAYQRVVRKAGQAPGADPIKVQSETLSRFFIQDPGQAECFTFRPLDQYDGEQLAAVRMNHLIETFYLFRLLVHYRVESGAEIGEDLRVELSGELTKLLHNGDRAKMSWLSDWLTKKIGGLGEKINALNARREKRVIFFLKGGRALNYFLETPEKGENDWDTQVVIDPSLPAEEWYRCFGEVHDELLVALKTFKAEFTQLVEQNSPQFAEYLKEAHPKAAEDEEVDENEAGDVNSLTEHANCKAELIDIGIPRRDSPSALEEWTRLSSPGALLQSNGVVYPHREYYLNEYLMMIRDAFLPNAEVRKAPKRIARLGLILKSERGREAEPSPLGKKRLGALPDTARKIAELSDKGRRELLGVIISQFVEAYNLLQDKELAAHFDKECVTLISNPPQLPAGLADLLDDGQKATAAAIGVAHNLSMRMDEHWGSRNKFFEDRLAFFADFVRQLSGSTNQSLQKIRAQFAVAGSYAARLHADHLRINPTGLEPIRRILIKLQCARGRNRGEVLGAVRDDIKNAAKGTQKLTVTEGEKESLLLYWSEKVPIGNFTYAPLVMKVRVAEQSGDQLPVLSSIDGIPVVDPRYLVADYLKKTSKIDERGSRRVLASATAAVSEMLSRFDFESDDAG